VGRAVVDAGEYVAMNIDHEVKDYGLWIKDYGIRIMD